jgi:indolepyruvate ferredoxin oxidoreductase beta subunit
VSLGTHRYPNDNEVREILKQRTDKICFIDGTARAKELGDVRTLNLFMLGCVSNFMPIKLDVWEKCISERLPAKILQLNLKAFEQGRKETSNVAL